jgi:hypothetical protein
VSYILIVRNPRSKKLVPVLAEDNETIAEFATESDAAAVAMAVPICEAWGYQTVEVGEHP